MWREQGVRTLLKTSDSIEKARQTVNDSEDVAKHALVDLELQRSQLTGVKDMVADTNSMTGQVRHYLQIIADRSYRRRVCTSVHRGREVHYMLTSWLSNW